MGAGLSQESSALQALLSMFLGQAAVLKEHQPPGQGEERRHFQEEHCPETEGEEGALTKAVSLSSAPLRHHPRWRENHMWATRRSPASALTFWEFEAKDYNQTAATPQTETLGEVGGGSSTGQPMLSHCQSSEPGLLPTPGSPIASPGMSRMSGFPADPAAPC